MQQNIEIESNSQLNYLAIDNQAKKAIYMFHGYGASMFDLYGLAECLENSKDYDWYFPNGPLELMKGSHMSRAWFPIDMEALEKAMLSKSFREFSGEYPTEFQNSLELGVSFINSIQVNKNYDEVVIAGFSQGAMISSHLSLREDISINKLVLFSGNLIGRQHLLESKSKHIKFFQSHGKNDPILSYGQAKDLFEVLKLQGMTGEFVSFEGQHEIPLSVISKWQSFMLS